MVENGAYSGNGKRGLIDGWSIGRVVTRSLDYGRENNNSGRLIIGNDDAVKTLDFFSALISSGLIDGCTGRVLAYWSHD